MAAITGAIVAVGGLALSASQYAKSNKEKKDAAAKIDSFQQQDLVNPFENIKISTLAADQETDANLSRNASAVDALQRGGTRAVLGGIPRLSESNVLLQNLISKDIERQDQERQRLIANGEANIQNVRENRELGALQGLGQQLYAARQDQATAAGNIASSALAIGSSLNNSSLFGNGNENSGLATEPPAITTNNTSAVNQNASLFGTPNVAFSDFNFNSNS